MSAQQLITEHIDLWTSSIKARNIQGRGSSEKRELYGIKKLRELILELAVRGKLVPQDPNDEPASVLLERIAAERARQIKNKKIKQYKPLPGISEEEKLFELPDGWVYQRFIDVLDFSGGGQPPKSFFSDELQEGYVQLIQIRDLGPNPQPVYVLREKVSKFCTSNDVMVGRYGASVGKVFWGKDGAYNVALIKIHNDLNSYTQGFIYLLLKSPLGQGLFGGVSRSAQAGFSKDDIAPKLIPVLSLSEQKRIVTKVDELMALCDQLEQQTESSLDAHNLLVDTLLASLLKPAEGSLTDTHIANELSDNWARLADHFDTLITTDYAIEQLKQTILQLAVMGKLVPQDPNDEPASELLKRIAAEKEQLVKDKKIKKQKPLPEITDEEKPFVLPDGWEVARFGDLTSRLGSGSTPRGGKDSYVSSGIPFLRSQNVWNDGLKLDDVEYITNETHLKMDNTKVFPGDILLNITGASLGRSTIFPKELNEANVSQHVTIIRLLDEGMARFVHLGILSPLVQKLVWGRQVGVAIEGLSKKVLEQFEFPIPPLNEQHRIVSKVDELMSYCDQLKARIYDAQNIQIEIADALVSNVTGAELKDIEKMKVPKNELITKLKLKVSPNDNVQAPLSAILTEHKGELTANKLWALSKMDIDVFYQQLKIEMESDWIVEPEKAQMKEKS